LTRTRATPILTPVLLPFALGLSYHGAMLGIDRHAARYTWTAISILLLLATIYLVRKTLFVFIVALLFAYLLSPLVDLLDRFLPASRTRTPALVIAYLIIIGGMIFAGVGLGSRIADEARTLKDKFDQLAKPAPVAAANAPLVDRAIDYVRSQIREHASDIATFLPKIGLRALSAAGDVVYVVIVPILSFFFLKDGRAIWATLLELVEDGAPRALVENIAGDINVLLAQYMRALTVLSLFTLAFFSFYLTMTHVPYALLLAAIAGVLEFIPMVGPFSAAVIILVVSGFSGYQHLPWILVFLAVYRLFQDYVLSPRLMSQGMELHPLLVMFGVFAGGELGGVAGTFLSVPALALTRILYKRLERTRHAVELTQIT
jgi:predicted PurR-regulated permease PerM